MSAMECSLGGLAQLDTADLDAVMRMNEACLGMLLDPVLWGWMLGITAVSILGGALIGWIKGRMLAGIVWAAVLGPIGWIIVALSASRLPVCPECGKGNPANAKACRHCGVNLKQSAERTARSRLKGADSGGNW
jgi:ribosomal protein L40E